MEAQQDSWSGHPTPNDHHSMDGLAMIGSSAPDGFKYGTSSTIALVQRVIDEGRHPTASLLRRPRALSLEQVCQRDETGLVYPTRRTSGDYLSCYWEFCHPVFPVLHRPTFMKRYEQLWECGDSPDQHDPSTMIEKVTFTSTLNLLFALGCQFSKLVAPENRTSAAEEFYQRSRQIFIYDVHDSNSIALVQMLLLTGIYLQSTRHAARCWNVVGLAIRTAQSLGLHSESHGHVGDNQTQRETRRRIWHVCVTLDRCVNPP